MLKTIENYKTILPIIVFVTSFILFSAGISRNTIYILDEAKNSECAREMFEKGDYIVPTFNYKLRTDKPPLHYFFMVVSYKVFGVNEYAARLFSSIFGALTLLLIFLYARKYLNLKTAIYTVLILLASLNFALEFHLAVPDPYLIFFLTLSHLMFYDFYKTRKTKYLLTMYMAIALSILSKGPVALGLAGLNGLVFLFVKKEFKWSVIKEFKLITGFLIVSIIAVPWFVLVGLETEWEWTRGFFFEHNLDRFSSGKEGHGGIFLITPAFVMLAFLPFTVFIFRAFINAFKLKRDNDFLMFSLIISLVIISFFSISSTKLPNYPMPAYPFVAAIIAAFLAGGEKIRIKWPLWIHFIISIILPVGAYIGLKYTPGMENVAAQAFWILPVTLGAILSIWFGTKKNNFHYSMASLAGGWIFASLLLFMIAIPAIYKENPVYTALKKIDIEKPVAYYGRFNPAFSFYYKRVIPRLNTTEDVKKFFNSYPEGYLLSATQFEEELKDLPLNEIVRKQDIFEIPVTQVYKWKIE